MPSCLGVHPLMSSEVCLSPKTCVPPYFHLAASCWKWCRNRQTLPWKFLSLLSRLSSYYYNWDTSIKKDRVLTMQPYLRNTPRGGKRMAIRISQHVARTPPFPILQKFEKYLLWKKVVAENIPGKKNLKSHNIIIIININKNNKKGSSQ
jgi:hypothetical protein